jgi:hypothetical protein
VTTINSYAASVFGFSDTERALMTSRLADVLAEVVEAEEQDERPTWIPQEVA